VIDIFGQALEDYYEHLKKFGVADNFENIITWTNISDEDELPLSYLFRTYLEMPWIEQKALELCKGSILDVGCGAGSHSLWLQNQGYDVKGIDISTGAVSVAQKRGVKNVEKTSIIDVNQKFDTILMLMNGTGIFQTYDQVVKYLKHLRSILKPNGQILIDSSDISYMYDEDDFEGLKDKRYFGELDYFIKYKEDHEYPMTWLYLDFETLNQFCSDLSLNCEKIQEGEHFDYLARISKIV